MTFYETDPYTEPKLSLALALLKLNHGHVEFCVPKKRLCGNPDHEGHKDGPNTDGADAALAGLVG